MAVKVKEDRYLKISSITPPAHVARRLPPEVARRWHALPIGEDKDQITVAMADPDDQEGRKAIQSSLGTPICVVRADAGEIDHALGTLWPEISVRNIRILHWDSTDPDPQFTIFSSALAGALNADHREFVSEEKGKHIFKALIKEADQEEIDLIVFKYPGQTFFQKLIFGQAGCKILEKSRASFLAARQARWPLRNILLVMRGEQIEDQSAVDWAVFLAKAVQARVTILPLISPIPLMYGGLPAMTPALPDLLKTETVLGKALRQAARRFVDLEIECSFHLRNETPYWQIQNEASREAYDLIIVDSEQCGDLSRLLREDVVDPLLSWTNVPVLIAKPLINREKKELS